MQVCYNGAFFPASEPVFAADNRGFRYGDGVFETARVSDGALLLADYHFDRLLQGLHLLQMRHDTRFRPTIHEAMLELCSRNSCMSSARVRLAVFRGVNDCAEYIIEATPIPPRAAALPEDGWRIDVFADAIKACDSFSNLKSANYLLYLMAQRYAAERGLDECLVLNNRNSIADGSKTNVFALIDDAVYTPPLSAGCVDGVMRRHVMARLGQVGYVVKEKDLDLVALREASELFLTNAIEGIRWVKNFGSTNYGNGWIKDMYTAILRDPN